MKTNKKYFLFLVILFSAFVSSVKAEEGKITVAQAFYELAHQGNE